MKRRTGNEALGPRRRRIGGIALGLLLSLATGAGAMAEPLVEVAEGRLAGLALPNRVSAFLGVRFAAPPTGERRWRAPAPAAPWTGLRQANAFGPSCPQMVAPGGFGPWTPEYVVQGPVAEDCLFLNVWTTGRAKRLRPVVVWIHGGAFISGSGSAPIYDGARLAEAGAVVVTVNYRLGALGFLAHPELTAEAGASGNYGLMDQVAALAWVRKNIAAFGGDPDQVTIAGQSAGAISVLALLEAPKARGLFARAIAQSGAGLTLPMSPRAEAEARGERFAASTGASSIAALRALPPEKLNAPPTMGPGGAPVLQFVPIRDGSLLPAKPGPLARIPLMTGLTADEGSGFNPTYGRATLASHTAMVKAQFGASAEEILRLYPAQTDAEARLAALELARDRGIVATLDWLDARVGRTAPAYAYLYDHPEPGPGVERFGAFHSSEIPYVLKTLHAGQRPFTEADHRLSDAMSAYWLNFVRRGDPNGAALAAWSPHRPRASNIMELGDRFGPRELRADRLQALRRFREAGGQLSVF